MFAKKHQEKIEMPLRIEPKPKIYHSTHASTRFDALTI